MVVGSTTTFQIICQHIAHWPRSYALPFVNFFADSFVVAYGLGVLHSHTVMQAPAFSIAARSRYEDEF